MTSIPDSNPFFGLWKLNRDRSSYQLGAPPLEGTYRLEPDDNAILVTMKWTSVDGQSFEQTYRGIPDGVDYPFENPAVADFVSMTRVDDRTLDSAVKKGGQVTSHARRRLSDDGNTMEITMSGIAPDGSTYSNFAVYERVE